jgi:hypothetical protein
VLRPDSRNETLALIRSRLGPDSLDRIELVGLGFHWPNASLVHGLHNVLGYNPVRLRLYTQATGAGDHAALPEQRTFSPLFPSYRSVLADLLGLRLVVSGVPIETIDPRLAPGDWPLVARTADGFVYENPRALPRVLYAGRAIQADPDALLRTGAWPEVDTRTTVVLADAPAEGAMPGEGSAVVEGYSPTEVVVAVRAASPGYLVLNDPYHPWWEAEVDGREERVLQANVLFRAVRVGPGSHRVRFVFRPFRGAWRELRRRWPALDRVAGRIGALL